MIADGFSPEFVEIYHEFLAEMPGLFATLKEKVAANDAAQAARAAHQIKGSSANFGFTGVSAPVSILEQDAKGGSLANAHAQILESENAFHSAVQEVKIARGV